MNINQANNSSKAFYLAYQRCMEKRPVPGGIEFPVVPAVVCGVFSVELGFKTLILQTDGSPSGHDLAELFESIDQAAQSALIKASGIPEPQFRSDLAAIANAFIEWRYIYEKPSISVNAEFLGKLARAIQAAL